MQAPQFHTRLLSYFYPVRVRSGGSADNAILELYLYRGQWQLATADALYSDGYRYRPLVVAFNYLKTKLNPVKKVLVLGTGLGSAVQIMNRMGLYPEFTLVDIDKLVLQWAIEILGAQSVQRIKPVCADARIFVETHSGTYDLVIIDIFIGRLVPAFVTTKSFLQQCRRSINPGGYLILNYIINDEKKWHGLKALLDVEFPRYQVKDLGINRVIIVPV